ncbi:MAG: Putative protease [Nitrospira sp.]|jgi:subtilisin family serine protease|nr:MAG: Putative protease [Nitrospira sp.]
MLALDLVKLTPLMQRTSGSPALKIGLIDGPVATRHPNLSNQRLLEISGNGGGSCTQVTSTACLHGTFVVGILSATRDSPAPAICPDCTVLIRPIFAEATSGHEQMPSATPQELAAAIIECIDSGARVINLSLALVQSSGKGEQPLEAALNEAVRRRVIVVAAAGNQGTLGSSVITRHPWVIPVVACDRIGRPISESNLGGSIGRRGLSAPGAGITSLGIAGRPLTLGGTSVAVPFVTGAIALLWSEFPTVNAAQIKSAVTQVHQPRQASVVPPLLNGEAAYQSLSATYVRGDTHGQSKTTPASA